MARVLALELVAVDEPRRGTGESENGGQLAHIVLPVAVCVEDVVFLCRGEAGAKGAAIASILGVGDDAHVRRVVLAEFLKHVGGIVVAAVVDDDHLVVVDVLAQDFEGPGDEGGQGRRVVVGREEDAERRKLHAVFSPMRMSDWPTGKVRPAPIHAASAARAVCRTRSSHGETGSTPLEGAWRVSGSQIRNFARAMGMRIELA